MVGTSQNVSLTDFVPILKLNVTHHVPIDLQMPRCVLMGFFAREVESTGRAEYYLCLCKTNFWIKPEFRLYNFIQISIFEPLESIKGFESNLSVKTLAFSPSSVMFT